MVAPLAPQRYKVQSTASAQTYEKLRRAQDLLGRQIPDGDLDQIVDRVLTALEHLAKQKFAATERPRGGKPTAPSSRRIPAEVKRAVWLRDGGRCAFVGKSGRRCTATAFLEFHDVQPYAVGASPRSITSRCAAARITCTKQSCTSVHRRRLESGRSLLTTRSGPTSRGALTGATSWDTRSARPI